MRFRGLHRGMNALQCEAAGSIAAVLAGQLRRARLKSTFLVGDAIALLHKR